MCSRNKKNAMKWWDDMMMVVVDLVAIRRLKKNDIESNALVRYRVHRGMS